MSKLYRTHTCLACRNVWIGEVTLSLTSPAISGERMEQCPVCNSKGIMSSARHESALLERFNAMTISRPAHFTPLEEGTVLDMFTKEVWEDLGLAGKGEYLSAIADRIGMVPDDMTCEAREERVSEMVKRFEAGMSIFENDSLSTEEERIAALGEE